MIDPIEFRMTLGQFATGITIVTTSHEAVAYGMTVNSFTSVSLTPPLVLFCADKRARTHAAVAVSGVFAVNILGQNQRWLSELFAGKGTDDERQAVMSKQVAVTGSPILADVLAYLDCKVVQAHDAGDHVIYVGEVVATDRGDIGAPLLYFRGSYQALDRAWPWRDRSTAKTHSTPFHTMADFFEQMQTEGPYAELLDKLLMMANATAHTRCLDVGCGPGCLTRKLGFACSEAVGVDASPKMVAYASERAKALQLGNVSFVQTSAKELPLPDAAFDVVTVSNTLLHLPNPTAALKEVARVLRPGGQLAILEPTMTMTHKAMSTYVREHRFEDFAAYVLLAWADAAEAGHRYDDVQMAVELNSAGFNVVTQLKELGDMVLLTLAQKN